MYGKVGSTSRSWRPRDLKHTGRKPEVRRNRLSPDRVRHAATLLVLVGAPTAILAFFGSASPIDLLLILFCKLAAIAAMGGTQGRKRDATPAQRVVLIEAITLGTLVAFVAGLALGPNEGISRPLLLLDWLGTLSLIEIVRRFPRSAKAIEEQVHPRVEREPEPLPEVAAAIRNRVVMLAIPDGPIGTELIDRIEALAPAGWIFLGGDPRRIDRLGWGVVRLDRELSEIREIFTRIRPDIVIQILGPTAEDEAGHAASARKLVNEALRVGVASFVLVANENRRGAGTILAERIVGALSGLTRSRLVRIRLRDDIENGAAARRILRIAAKGRDGTIVTLSKTGGSCLEGLGGRGDSQELWGELDRLTQDEEPKTEILEAVDS